ncbi:MAG: signal recognition particle-docking protein FtsY [Desulfuromonas sp.]|nr:MAG: signal recognition particle-docking protein FtsY [Desulfuromonas sp.]
MENSEAIQALIRDVLEGLGRWLGQLGVPEQYLQQAALGVLFAGATLLVLLLILLLMKARSAHREVPPPETSAPESEVEEAETAAIDAGQEAETVAEVDAAAPEEPETQSESPTAPAAEVAVEAVETAVVPEEERVDTSEVGLFRRLRSGLAKTQASLVGRLDDILKGGKGLQPDMLEDLEEILITADLGMKTTQDLVGAVEQSLARNELADAGAVRELIRSEMVRRLAEVANPVREAAGGPSVIMVVGVNGVGKTTTIGKLASRLAREGKKVVLGAGDTFRAAAAEQLTIWGERAGVDVVRHAEGADPAAVAFDAAKAAVARKADVLILDTAGRLHTKSNLMEELKKVRRVLAREVPDAPHETLLVLDATTGQNALVQARLFSEAVEVTGLAMTKLDGTARGGIIIAIANDLGLPVRYIGIGESVEDLRPFDPEEFVAALFETD